MDNNHWYDLNAATAYPLADTATELADDGTRLPSHVLVDLHLRYPQEYGEYAFLGALTVTDRVVAVVVEAALSLTPDYGLQPLAVLTVAAGDLAVGRQYPLVGQVAGVAGWLAFGEGAAEFGRDGVPALRLRFSTPGQGLLCARAARKYRPLPVVGLGSYTASRRLDGVVSLTAEPPLEVVKASRSIGGVERDVAVVRLVRQEGGSGFETSEQEQALDGLVRSTDVLRKFAGPCGGRPESRTCGDPQPVEFVNSVGPDCDGVLTLDFRGCADVAHVEDPCSILLRCDYGIGQVCPRPFIPDGEGRLPSEYDEAEITPPDDTTDDTEEGDEESRTFAGELPYVECFDGEPVEDFVTKSGEWELAADDSPYEWEYCPQDYTLDGTSIDVSLTDGSYESQLFSVKNLAVWEGFDLLNLGRVTTVDLLMRPAGFGGRHNGGVVLNYRPHPTIPSRYVYYTAEVDYDVQEFRIRRFNGLDYTPVAVASVPGILLGRWFRVAATVVEGPSPGQTRLSARLIDLAGTIDVAIGPVDVTGYAPSSGYNGLIADRAQTRFSFFHYAEAP